MAAQTTYNFGMQWGPAGGIFDLAPHEVQTFMAGADFTQYGLGVFTEDGKTVVVKDDVTGQSPIFVGITVNNFTREHGLYGAGDTLLIQQKSAMGVMTYGNIWGLLAAGAAPAYGKAVYVTDAGTFTDASTDNTPINAKFLTGAKNGVAVIELQQANVVDAT